MNVKVVAIDADPAIRRLLKHLLSGQGYEAICVGHEVAAFQVIARQNPAFLLLDDPELCPQIRGQWPHLPMMVLLSAASEQAVVRVLNLGADDCVSKPFGTDELVARIRTHVRRAYGDAGSASSNPTAEAITSADGFIALHAKRSQAFVGGQEVPLTRIECELLRALMLHPERVLTHRFLLQWVWGPAYGEERGHVRVYVYLLRRKLEADPAHPRYIVSHPGIGYLFHVPVP